VFESSVAVRRDEERVLVAQNLMVAVVEAPSIIRYGMVFQWVFAVATAKLVEGE